MKIASVLAREIFDSRGWPTVEVEITLDSGDIGVGMVPSGASTGSKEALELRDGDSSRFLGKGVTKAVTNVNTVINDFIKGKEFPNQESLDNSLISLDGTENKSSLGANALLAVSLAFARACSSRDNKELYHYLKEQYVGSKEDKYSLPMPMLNFINGGAHADNNVDIQEFMLVPTGASTLREALQQSAEVFHTLKKILKEKGLQTAVGDEGGFAPDLSSNKSALELLCEAVHVAGYTPGKDFHLALDVAASEIYNDGSYYLKSEQKSFSSEEFANYLMSLADEFPIISIEDGMAEDDLHGWSILTKLGNDRIQLVGDDLMVTNPTILKDCINDGLANSILIKFNQIGTLTETVKAVQMAQESGYGTIISHRSGETEDTFISDLSVSLSAGQIKTGSLSRSDRVAKYNRLLRIEDSCSNAKFSGRAIFSKYLG